MRHRFARKFCSVSNFSLPAPDLKLQGPYAVNQGVALAIQRADPLQQIHEFRDCFIRKLSSAECCDGAYRACNAKILKYGGTLTKTDAEEFGNQVGHCRLNAIPSVHKDAKRCVVTIVLRQEVFQINAVRHSLARRRWMRTWEA